MSQRAEEEDAIVDQAIQELGSWGRFHLLVYALMTLATIASEVTGSTFIFLAGDVPYR